MIDSIEKITLYVKNQKEARDFWTERMGFIVRLEQQMGADQKWLEVGPEISRKCLMAACFSSMIWMGMCFC